MRWIRALPLGVLVLALLGTAAAVLRGPAVTASRVLNAPRDALRPPAPELVQDPLTTLLLGGSALLLAGACCWLALAVAACTWDGLRRGAALGGGAAVSGGAALSGGQSLSGEHGDSWLRPRLVRAVVATCLGVAALGSPSAQAQASAQVEPSTRALPRALGPAGGTTSGAAGGAAGARAGDLGAAAPSALARLLRGLPVPDRATGGVAEPPTTQVTASARAVGPPVTTVLEVAPGDSLWTLTAELLPRGAPVGAVVTGWHLLYAANRSVVGDDPDLLRPGQRLSVDHALTDLARSTARHSPTTPTDRRSP